MPRTYSQLPSLLRKVHLKELVQDAYIRKYSDSHLEGPYRNKYRGVLVTNTRVSQGNLSETPEGALESVKELLGN